MQQAENGGEEEATVDVQFTDLPNALIACKVPEDLFNEGNLRVSTKCSASVLVPATCTIYKHWRCIQLRAFFVY